MKFMIFSKSPQEQTILGIRAPTWSVTEVEAASLDDVVKNTKVPRHGEVHIVETKDVTTIKSELTTRVLPKGVIT